MRLFIHLKFILTHKGVKEKAEACTCMFKCRCNFICLSMCISIRQSIVRVLLKLIILKYKFIYFNWRLITLQYCIGFAMHWHESTTGKEAKCNDLKIKRTASILKLPVEHGSAELGRVLIVLNRSGKTFLVIYYSYETCDKKMWERGCLRNVATLIARFSMSLPTGVPVREWCEDFKGFVNIPKCQNKGSSKERLNSWMFFRLTHHFRCSAVLW